MGREKFRQQPTFSRSAGCRLLGLCLVQSLWVAAAQAGRQAAPGEAQGRPVLVKRPAVPGTRGWSSFPREVHPTGPQQLLSPEAAGMLREEIEPEVTGQETKRRILQKEKTLGVSSG